MKRIFLFFFPVLSVFSFLSIIDLSGAEENVKENIKENIKENVKRNYWRTNFRTARKSAKEEGKLLLLFFTVSDSTHLNKQMILLYRTSRYFLEKSASDFVLVHIDLPNDPEKISITGKRRNQYLRNRFSVSTFPAFVLADPTSPWGTLLYKRQGKISPDELLDILNKKFASKLKKMQQDRKKTQQKMQRTLLKKEKQNEKNIS